MGDGCAYRRKTSRGSNYQFSITCFDRDICEQCGDICSTLFTLNARIKDVLKDGKYSYSQLVICSKPLVEWVVNATKDKQTIPAALSTCNHRAFLQGVMDTDGWIMRLVPADGYLRFRVGFKNTAGWTVDIRQMIEALGVRVGKLRTVPSLRYARKTQDCFTFSINAKTYCEKIGFRCERKDSLAKGCLEHYGINQTNIQL